MAVNKNIRIEEVADVNYDYPYLEVFYKDSSQPFLDVGITDNKELNFKFYISNIEVNLSMEDVEHIQNSAKEFFFQALKNEDDFLRSHLSKQDAKHP